MALNDAKVKAAKAKAEPYKLADSGQLYLQVTTAGSKIWRMNYTFGRNASGRPKQRTLTFGAYPIISLGEAREQRDAAKRVLLDDRDPAVEKKLQRGSRRAEAEATFASVFRRWFVLKSGWDLAKRAAWIKLHRAARVRDARHWTDADAPWSAVHSDDVYRSIERDALPALGQLPIGSIDAALVLTVLEAVQKRGSIESAQRLRQRLSDVFGFAIPIGLCKTDPAPPSLLKLMKERPKARKQPSIVDRIRDLDARVAAVRQLLADCDAQGARAGTKWALRFLMLTATRPGEAAGARWDEMHLDGPEPTWVIPPVRMKGDRDRKGEEGGEHIVPLSRQAVELLEAIRLVSGQYTLLFPSELNLYRPISEGTMNGLLQRAGYKGRHVPHGCRGAFSTIMNERADRAWRALGQSGQAAASPDRAIIDLQLAHVPKDKVEGAYNRAAYLPRRRELLQEWADLIVVGLGAPMTQIGRPIR